MGNANARTYRITCVLRNNAFRFGVIGVASPKQVEMVEKLGSKRRILALTSLGHFVNDGSSFFVPVIAALLTTGRGFSLFEIGTTLVIYYASSSLLSPFVGRLGDRGSLGHLLALGMALLGGGLLGFYLSLALLSGTIGFAMAVVASFILGFGTAFYHPLGGTILQRNYGREEVGMALGVNGAMGSLGRALYPLFYFLAGLAIVADDSILAFAAVGFVSAMIILRSVRSSNGERADEIVKRSPRTRQALTRGIILLTVISFVRFSASQGIVAWIPTYLLQDHITSSASWLGLLVFVMYLGGVGAQLIFGFLTKSVDLRLLLGLNAAGTSLATLGFLWTTGLPSLGFLFLIGFFSFSAFPIMLTLSMGYVEEESSTLGNSLVFGLGTGAGNALGPLMVVVLSANNYSNLPLGFDAMIVLGLVSALSVAVLPAAGKLAKTPLLG